MLVIPCILFAELYFGKSLIKLFTASEDDLDSERAYTGELRNTNFQLESLCHRDSLFKYVETKVSKYGSETQRFPNV